MIRCRPVVFVVLLFVILNCADDNPESPQSRPQVTVCSGPVTVIVGPGTTPTFSWSPPCSLFFILVEPENLGADQWTVITDSTNGIIPPVTYGVVPLGATGTSAATLVTGMPYEVFVGRWTGPGIQDGELIGSVIFTP